eukprot:1733247-Rhodomonas_salina.2
MSLWLREEGVLVFGKAMPRQAVTSGRGADVEEGIDGTDMRSSGRDSGPAGRDASGLGRRDVVRGGEQGVVRAGGML